MYYINPTTGSLTLNASATNPTGTIATGVQPFRIDFDPSGKFLYVTNEDGPTSIYTVNTNGTLTNTGTTGVATGSLATAFTKSNQ
jgi:DNA-binding beta-propeller fold protein YncE